MSTSFYAIKGAQGESDPTVIEALLDGLSAYNVWLAAGNEGTREDFLTSLVGPQGVQGIKGDQGDVGPQGQGSYTDAEILTKVKAVDGSGSELDADLLDGQHASFFQDAGNLNAGILHKDRLPHGLNLRPIQLDSGVNWDTITEAGEYYSSSDSLVETMVGTPPNAKACHLSVDQNTGVTQTYQGYSNHPQRWRRHQHNGVWSPWMRIYATQDDFRDVRETRNEYSNQNGYDSWISGENFDGDTGIGLADIRVRRHLFGDLCLINYNIHLIGFSKPTNTDATFQFRFNIGEVMTHAGWLKPKIVNDEYGLAFGRFGASGQDWPTTPWATNVYGDGSAYPNTIHFINSDRVHYTTSTSATDLYISGFNVMKVKD